MKGRNYTRIMIKGNELNLNNTYYDDTIITPDEYDRISYEVTIEDFNTHYPDRHRIDRIMRGINEYKNYKRKHQRGDANA